MIAIQELEVPTLGDNQAEILNEIVAQHRSLAMLCALRNSPAHVSNEKVLRDYLARVGLASSEPELRATLQHLEASGALTTTREQTLLVVTLTSRGDDVATGVTKMDGVSPPGPECPY